MTDYSVRKEKIKYFKNGQLKKHYFLKNGQLDGEYKTYYYNSNEQLSQHTFYKHGIRDGEYKKFYPNGQLCAHFFYKSSYPIAHLYKNHDFYKNEQYLADLCKYHNFYKYEQYVGEQKTYYLNGQLEIWCFYKKGKLEEYYKEYFDDGQLSYITFYKNGVKREKKSYREGGFLYKYKRYYENDNGKLTSFLRKEYYNGLNLHLNLQRVYFFSGYTSYIELNFKIYFSLLKFRDIFKNKTKKPRYELLDKHFISDISNIIVSYMYTLSKFNESGKRILL